MTTPDPVANTLSGTVLVDGLPAARRVVALRRHDLSYVAATYSNAITGAWHISGVPVEPADSLLVLAFDDSGTYNAEAYDFISQVA